MSELITIPKLAKELGLSRIAVYRKVKNGQIPAIRVGRNYAVRQEIAQQLKSDGDHSLDWIDAAVSKVVQEYGPVLKWLSAE